MTKEDILIRRAERQDVPLLLDFIRGIAWYEKMENEMIASSEVLEREMFDEHRAEAVFAVVDGREVGFALYFYNFSTFIGHSGLYLEDLFVWPPVCMAGRARQGLWQGSPAASCQNSTRASLRTHGMDLPELEPAQHRLLSLTWSRAHE